MMPDTDDTLALLHGSPLAWAALDRHCPDFVVAYRALAAVPQQRQALPARWRELILLAMDAAVSHLHRDGMRAHIRGALREGASADEIVEVLQLVSVLGIHATSIGFPALKDIAAAAGKDDQLPGPDLTAEQASLRDQFRADRGYWNAFWEEALKLDTPLFSAYYAFSSVPWRQGVLDPKLREFIYVAIDASTTHMFDDGTRGHMANAFKYGATVSELLEVLELATTLGIQSATIGIEILEQELARGAGQ